MTASNVSFLNSGNLLHTIFPRSQCWCVDNQSVFVLRIRQDSYYRMELPYDTEEDKEKTSQFKSVLGQVLQYEKTQCPFTRGFEAEEIERPRTPPRKQLRRQPPTQKAKKWVFDKTWAPQNGPRPSTPSLDASDSGTTSSYEEDDRSSIHTDLSEAMPESSPAIPDTTPSMPQPSMPSVAQRASVFQSLRAVTAPVGPGKGSSLVSMEPIAELSPREQNHREAEKPILERQVSDVPSLVSSVDSFYSPEPSGQSTPSPPFLDAEADLLSPWAEAPPKPQSEVRGRSTHRRQISEVTVRSASQDYANSPTPFTPTVRFQPSSAPSTPPLVSDSDDDSVKLPSLDVSTPPDAIRMRRLTGASQRRAFSPMPHAQNLFYPQKRTPGRDFTDALVRKTYELVLGPPAHLVTLMLRIAQTISNGFGFRTYRMQRTEKIPCSWESDSEMDWADEDDFGIPLNNVGSSTVRRRTFSGEVD